MADLSEDISDVKHVSDNTAPEPLSECDPFDGRQAVPEQLSIATERKVSESPSRKSGFNKIQRRLVKHSLKHGNLIFTGISAAASVLSAWFFFSSLQTSDENLRVSLNVYERGYVDHLAARYAFSGEEEYLVIRNSGLKPATHIIARRVPYFIFKDRAVSARGLGYELQHTSSSLAKLQQQKILLKSADYPDLMGPDRELGIEVLMPQGETEVEVSESSNLNGVKVADALGCIFVVLWHISFTSGPEQIDTKQDIGFWLSHNNTRRNLSDLSWGDSIISMIDYASKHSSEYLLEVPVPSNVPITRQRHGK